MYGRVVRAESGAVERGRARSGLSGALIDTRQACYRHATLRRSRSLRVYNCCSLRYETRLRHEANLTRGVSIYVAQSIRVNNVFCFALVFLGAIRTDNGSLLNAIDD